MRTGLTLANSRGQRLLTLPTNESGSNFAGKHFPHGAADNIREQLTKLIKSTVC